MSKPLWTSGLSKETKKANRLQKKMSRSKFFVEYDLIYDGGGVRWIGYYRTYWGARLAAWKEVHVSSWGGSAELYSYPRPVRPPTVGPSSDRKKRNRGR